MRNYVKAHAPKRNERARINAETIQWMAVFEGGCGVLDGSCLGGLLWHHIDAKTKNYELGMRPCASWKSLLSEIDLCIVLCQRHHTMLHRFLEGKKLSENLSPEFAEFVNLYYPLIITQIS
ncbi:hypothetical protein KKE60_08585 [Patescibacteria group bacterium]|nr:hypothetical protein [Patescibacteria group bacterium]